jgi:hypothetical protein
VRRRAVFNKPENNCCLGTKRGADAAFRQNSVSRARAQAKRRYVPNMDAGHTTTRFARVDFRNDDRVFGIKDEDRFLHVYVIGKTGTGKSSLIETMALQDLQRGNGFALIDPHGDLVARVAARIPASHRDKVMYLDATDPTQPYGYNPLRHVSEDRIALAASGMMDVFKKMWPDAWGVRMEHILRTVLIVILVLGKLYSYRYRRLCRLAVASAMASIHGRVLLHLMSEPQFDAITPEEFSRIFHDLPSSVQRGRSLQHCSKLSRARLLRTTTSISQRPPY